MNYRATSSRHHGHANAHCRCLVRASEICPHPQMSHVTHTCESSYAHTSVTSHVHVRRVTHACESCQNAVASCARARSTHTHKCIDEACCKYKWVMLHIHLSHFAQPCESCNTTAASSAQARSARIIFKIVLNNTNFFILKRRPIRGMSTFIYIDIYI